MNKQYLLLIEESNMPLMKQCFMGLGLQFLEVQGMPMSNANAHVLMTPVIPPVNQMTMETPMPVETSETDQTGEMDG